MSGLAIVGLPDGPEQELRLPSWGWVVAGFFEPDGSVVAVIEQEDRVRVYRASVNAPPVPIGRPLRGSFTYSLAGRMLLAAGCGARPVSYLLELDGANGWHEVAATCGASLSPGARSFVWSQDGLTLEEQPLPGGAAKEILDVTEIADLPPGIDRSARIEGSAAWSADDLAVPLATEEHSAVVTTAPGQEPYVAPLGRRAPASAVLLAWQPQAERLAVASSSTLEGVVRLLDARTGTPRVVSLFSEPPVGLIWSPNGDSLLVATAVRWTIMSPEGDWLWSVPVRKNDAQPLAWRR